MNAPFVVNDNALFAATSALNARQRADLALGDMFDRVREEIEASRATMPDILLPGGSLHAALGAFLCDLRWSPGDAASRARLQQGAARLSALALRLAIEGTSVWPDTVPDRKPDLRARAGR